MIAKKKDLATLRREYLQKSRINTAPGVRVSRTTRGQSVRAYGKANSGGGKSFVPKWG
jgi:hypothetical protein